MFWKDAFNYAINPAAVQSMFHSRVLNTMLEEIGENNWQPDINGALYIRLNETNVPLYMTLTNYGMEARCPVSTRLVYDFGFGLRTDEDFMIKVKERWQEAWQMADPEDENDYRFWSPTCVGDTPCVSATNNVAFSSGGVEYSLSASTPDGQSSIWLPEILRYAVPSALPAIDRAYWDISAHRRYAVIFGYANYAEQIEGLERLLVRQEYSVYERPVDSIYSKEMPPELLAYLKRMNVVDTPESIEPSRTALSATFTVSIDNLVSRIQDCWLEANGECSFNGVVIALLDLRAADNQITAYDISCIDGIVRLVQRPRQ